MSRKKTTAFYEVRADTPLEPRPSARPIRSEHRAEQMDLKALANRLAALPVGMRRSLPLDEETLDQLDRLANAAHTPDRRRMLMHARTLLASADLPRVEAALAGDTDSARWDRESDRWRARILAGDDQVIQAFIEEFPGANRQALRTSAREARGQGPAAARAAARLLQLIRAAPTAVSADMDGGDDEEGPA